MAPKELGGRRMAALTSDAAKPMLRPHDPLLPLNERLLNGVT
jgi:hypothetical protein